MQDFQGKVTVITGAGSGIGRALAMRLAREGMRLALSDIDGATLEQTLRGLPGGVEARAYVFDAGSREAMVEHAAQVEADFGAVRLLVNNAGATIVGTIEHLSFDEIEWQLRVNLWSAIHGTKAFLPAMLQRREGCIVNLSSVFGLVAVPTQGAYCMSKFAVRALNECLWSELQATGVEVVSVHPGGIRTNVAKSARRAAAAGAIEDEMMARSGRSLLTPPEAMADAIVDGLKRGRRRIVAGHASRLLDWLPRLLPDRYPQVLARLAGRSR